MSTTGLKGTGFNVDTTQIGVPVVTPRKERPGHKRSMTGTSISSEYTAVEADQKARISPLYLVKRERNGLLAIRRHGRML
jgi:hypothetical protein